MIRIFFVLILLISNSFADIQIRKQNDLFCYDGDTCYVIYEGKKDKVRLLDIDTPEISNPKCEKEYILAIEAREYINQLISCLLYTSPSPRDRTRSRMPSSA